MSSADGILSTDMAKKHNELRTGNHMRFDALFRPGFFETSLIGGLWSPN